MGRFPRSARDARLKRLEAHLDRACELRVLMEEAWDQEKMIRNGGGGPGRPTWVATGKKSRGLPSAKHSSKHGLISTSANPGGGRSSAVCRITAPQRCPCNPTWNLGLCYVTGGIGSLPSALVLKVTDFTVRANLLDSLGS